MRRQRRRAEAVLMLLNLKSGDTVLDVGCGDGFMTSFLAKFASFVVGIDFSRGELKIAKSKVKSSNADFILGDITKLPFRPSSFNKAAVLEVLEHLSKPEFCVEGVDKCTTDDAVLVISVPWKEQITYIRCIHCGKLTPLWGHLHSFDLENIISIFPDYYRLQKKVHLPNIALISSSKVFSYLPTRLWLLLNNFLGKIRKGYWIVLRFRKIIARTQ